MCVAVFLQSGLSQTYLPPCSLAVPGSQKRHLVSDIGLRSSSLPDFLAVVPHMFSLLNVQSKSLTNAKPPPEGGGFFHAFVFFYLRIKGTLSQGGAGKPIEYVNGFHRKSIYLKYQDVKFGYVANASSAAFA